MLLNLMLQATFYWYSPRPKRKWVVNTLSRTSIAVIGRTSGTGCNIHLNIDEIDFGQNHKTTINN